MNVDNIKFSNMKKVTFAEVLELTRLVGNVGGERMNRYGGPQRPVIIPSG